MKKIITYFKTSHESPIFSMLLIPGFGFLMINIYYPVELQSESSYYMMAICFILGGLGVWSIIYQIKNSISFSSKTPPSELKTWDEIFTYYYKHDTSETLKYWLKKHYKDPILK